MPTLDIVQPSANRDRVIEAAYPLFVERGIDAVAVSEIEHGAGLSAAAVHDVFVSKDAIAYEFLQQRELEWSYGMVGAQTQLTGASAEERLLGIFEVFHEWFQRDDYEACLLISVLMEQVTVHPHAPASVDYLARIHEMVTTVASEIRLKNPTGFALAWHVLMKGAIFGAVDGDGAAALRAKQMAGALIQAHRVAESTDDADDFASAALWLESR